MEEEEIARWRKRGKEKGALCEDDGDEGRVRVSRKKDEICKSMSQYL